MWVRRWLVIDQWQLIRLLIFQNYPKTIEEHSSCLGSIRTFTSSMMRLMNCYVIQSSINNSTGDNITEERNWTMLTTLIVSSKRGIVHGSLPLLRTGNGHSVKNLQAWRWTFHTQYLTDSIIIIVQFIFYFWAPHPMRNLERKALYDVLWPIIILRNCRWWQTNCRVFELFNIWLRLSKLVQGCLTCNKSWVLFIDIDN